MNFFKKKPPKQQIELNCPIEGCEFVTYEKTDLDKHLNWKHSEKVKKE